MGVFQKIRDNSALTMIVVGGAILLFVLSDSLSSNNSGDTTSNNIGSIEGVDINKDQFDYAFNRFAELQGQNPSNLTGAQKENLAQTIWNGVMLNPIRLKGEIEATGIGVGDNELIDMLVGDRPSQFLIGALFGGNDQGAYFRSVYPKLKQALDESEEGEDLVKLLEDFAAKQTSQGRLRMSYGEIVFFVELAKHLQSQSKYSNLLSKCMYATSSLAKNEYTEKYTTKDVRIGKVPYYLFPDSTVQVSESEIKDYYQANKEEFKVENASRKINIGVIRIDPSLQDEDSLRNWATQIVTDFKVDEDPELFVDQESDGEFDASYHSKGGSLTRQLDSIYDKEVGYVFGPYTDYKDGKKTYNVAKVLDAKMLGDSAKVSHVYFDYIKKATAKFGKNAQPSKEEAQKFQQQFFNDVDSFYTKLKKRPQDFDMLVEKFSDDSVTKAKNGSLGWIKEGTSQIPNIMDTIIFSEKGAIHRMFDRNGIHFIRIDDYGTRVRKVKLGVVYKALIAGAVTRNNHHNTAKNAAKALRNGQTLTAVRDSFPRLSIDSAQVKPFNYTVRGYDDTRDVITWAFTNGKLGDVKVFKKDEIHMVAQVAGEQEKGYRPLSDPSVQKTIKEKLIKEKKVALIKEKIGALTAESVKKLPDLVKGATVQVSGGIKVKQGVAQFSLEPAVNGAVAGLGEGKVSEVIQGGDAALIVLVEKVTPATVTAETNFDAEFNAIKGQGGQASRVFEELVKYKSDIEDNRQNLTN